MRKLILRRVYTMRNAKEVKKARRQARNRKYNTDFMFLDIHYLKEV